MTGGVFRIARGAGPLAARARAAGWRWHDVDLADASDKPALLAAFARDLALPGWFGGNWDALADALGDLGTASAVLHVLGAEGIAGSDPAAWAMARDILAEACAEWAADGRCLLVLLRGPAGRGAPAVGEDALPG